MREVVYDVRCQAQLAALPREVQVRVLSAIETVAGLPSLDKESLRREDFCRLISRLDRQLACIYYEATEDQVRVRSVELLYVSPQ